MDCNLVFSQTRYSIAVFETKTKNFHLIQIFIIILLKQKPNTNTFQLCIQSNKHNEHFDFKFERAN